MRATFTHTAVAACFYTLVVPAACEQVLFNSGSALAGPPVLNYGFSSYVKHLMNLWDIKGVSAAVVRLGSETEYGTWGERTEDGEKMTADTLFGIASCSKAFLSASMGILMDDFEKGRNLTSLPSEVKMFDWETKVTHLLPEDWKLQDQWASKKANVQDLLSHVTGIPRHDASYGPDDSARDLMYITGSHIITKYTGSYIDFVSKRIFEPLGMNSTTYSPTAAAASEKLSQSWTAHAQRIPFWFIEDMKEFNAGAGGVITNVVDLSKWLRLLLNSGIIPETDETIIPASAFQRITTAHTISLGKAASPQESVRGYGMGWNRYSYQSHEMLAHGGAIPGFSTFIGFFPKDNLGIAILANAGDKAPVVQALLYRAAEIALGLARIDRAEDPSAQYPERPTRPENTNTTLHLESYAGTYTSPGYGSFTLCDPAGSSFYCQEVLSAFTTVDNARSLPYPPPPDVPQLFGAWPRVWSTHIRLAHFENDTFDVVLPALFPEGYGRSKTPFETYELDQYSGKAGFVVQREKVLGFGFYGTEAEMKGKRGEGVKIQEGAIAWFRKV